jgi:hypothetical protein
MVGKLYETEMASKEMAEMPSNQYRFPRDMVSCSSSLGGPTTRPTISRIIQADEPGGEGRMIGRGESTKTTHLANFTQFAFDALPAGLLM